MLIISARRDFWDLDCIADDLQLFDVQADGSFGPFDWSDLREKRILLAIHGANETKDEVLPTYLALEAHMQSLVGAYDVIVGYLWPYCDVAGQIAHLRAAFRHVLGEASSCDLLAHGQGNELACEALLDLDPTPCLRDYLLTAPSAQSGRNYGEIPLFFRRLFLLHSREEFSHPFLSALSGLDQKDVDFERFVAPHNAQLFDCSGVVENHQSYWSCLEFFQLIKAETMGILPRGSCFELLPGGQISRG